MSCNTSSSNIVVLLVVKRLLTSWHLLGQLGVTLAALASQEPPDGGDRNGKGNGRNRRALGYTVRAQRERGSS
eukprot:2537285-Amphidinium_carterae.1